jgi:hypothetical protein
VVPLKAIVDKQAEVDAKEAAEKQEQMDALKQSWAAEVAALRAENAQLKRSQTMAPAGTVGLRFSICALPDAR